MSTCVVGYITPIQPALCSTVWSSCMTTLNGGGIARPWAGKKALCVLLGLMIPITTVSFVTGRVVAPTIIGKVYSVSDIQEGLRANPQRWNGRTVLVRGVTVGVSENSVQWGAIVDRKAMGKPLLPINAPGNTPQLVIIVVPRTADNPLRSLSRLPFVGPLLRRAMLGSRLQPGEAIYQLRLLPPHPHCALPPKAAPCPDGVLSTSML